MIFKGRMPFPISD